MHVGGANNYEYMSLRLLLQGHVHGRTVDGRHPTAHAIALCFRVPPRQPRLVGNLAARPRSTKILHVVAFMRDEQSEETIGMPNTCR